MRAFDKVIGYEEIKRDLLQVSDMIHNREIYDSVGAKLPKGILLSGKPGMGKSLMARCFIEECGIPSFTVRRCGDDQNFINSIKDAFENAKEAAPAIVFLDDMDKFANEDERHSDAKEYVTIQSCIDENRDVDIFIIATVNDENKLPESLLRAGRFDRTFKVKSLSDRDAEAIISFYLGTKKISPEVDFNDVSKMVSYSSCAELESIINDAAIRAAYARKTSVSMDEIITAVLMNEYNAKDCIDSSVSEDELREVALHEAGHAVMSEILSPGSVGMVSVLTMNDGNTEGRTRRCKRLSRRPMYLLTSLAGKAAVEMYRADKHASGCYSDIDKAVVALRDGIIESGGYGLGLVGYGRYCDLSENYRSRVEMLVNAELERYFNMAKDAFFKNEDFLKKVADELYEKKVLLYSDIQRIKASVKVTPISV